MCETDLDKKCNAKVRGIPLSDNTIGKIPDMSDDTKVQLIN